MKLELLKRCIDKRLLTIYQSDTKSTINVDGISVEVERKPIKNIHLSISPPDAQVHLSVPIILDDIEIHAFLKSKIRWIQKHVELVKKRTISVNKEYVSGEIHYFLGKPYVLNVLIHKHSPEITIRESQICMYVREHYTKDMKAAVLQGWYRRQLFVIIPPLIQKWEKILGVYASSFQIRPMKTRWGSCSCQTRRVHFNTNLATKSLRCIEYVIAHELTHIIVHGHNDMFYNILDSHFKDAQDLKRELKEESE